MFIKLIDGLNTILDYSKYLDILAVLRFIQKNFYR